MTPAMTASLPPAAALTFTPAAALFGAPALLTKYTSCIMARLRRKKRGWQLMQAGPADMTVCFTAGGRLL
jgi:hypothetical protein